MINLYVANIAKYNEGILKGDWINLPASEEEINEKIKDILGNDEEYAIHDTDIECDIDLKVSEYTDIFEINNYAMQFEKLSDHDFKKIAAILEWECSLNLQNILDNLDDYNLYEDINSEYDLGYYWIQESGCYDLKSLGNLANYFDYEAFGRDITFDGNGCFTTFGWIEKY